MVHGANNVACFYEGAEGGTDMRRLGILKPFLNHRAWDVLQELNCAVTTESAPGGRGVISDSTQYRKGNKYL